MKRREELQVNVAGLRRNIKNLAHNYSDAQVIFLFFIGRKLNYSLYK